MNDVANAVRARNGDQDFGTVADMDNYDGHLEHADLPRDCGLVELDGVVVAYCRASWQPMADGTREVDCILNVEPRARGLGIEGAGSRTHCSTMRSSAPPFTPPTWARM